MNIKRYNAISTMKAKEPQGNQPTHYLVAKENKDSTEKEFVASLWAKSGEKDGVKYNFLSGEMSKKFDGERPRKGFAVVDVDELDELVRKANTPTSAQMKANSPLGEEYPTEDDEGVPNPSDMAW